MPAIAHLKARQRPFFDGLLTLGLNVAGIHVFFSSVTDVDRRKPGHGRSNLV
jgi:hypothetical protein